jgi:hypothetical protein
VRIASACEADAADVDTPVGYPSSMLPVLERRAEVVRAFPFRQRLSCRRRRLTYRRDREPLMLKRRARQTEGRLRGVAAHCLCYVWRS